MNEFNLVYFVDVIVSGSLNPASGSSSFSLCFLARNVGIQL